MDRKKRHVFILCCVCTVASVSQSTQAMFLTRRQAQSAPRGRIACLSSSTPGTRYPNPFALGNHSYGFSLSERNGIVYACRGGHIDITHIRKLADWTAYLAYTAREALLANRTEFSFRLREPSIYHVRIEYPPGWERLPADRKDAICQEAAIELGQYLAHIGGIWHEILTWFGFKGIGFWPEYTSAFSWEDNYSNAIGCRLGAAALRDPTRSFSRAMTSLLDAELRALGVQPRPAAYRAGEAVRGLWFTGGFWSCDIIKRNFDLGFDDGFITPWLVPGLAGCNGAVPQEYPVPTLSSLEKLGFSIRLEIEPREWEKTFVLPIIHRKNKRGQRIEPAVHFGPIVEFIRSQAVERYGPFVDDRLTPSKPVSRLNTHKANDSEELAVRAARWLAEDGV